MVENQRWLGIIAAPEQRRQRAAAAAANRNYWPGADVCYGYLVRLHVRLRYWGRD